MIAIQQRYIYIYIYIYIYDVHLWFFYHLPFFILMKTELKIFEAIKYFVLVLK